MTRKQRRLSMIAGALAALGVAMALILFALRDNIVFFYSPSDVAAKVQSHEIKSGGRVRIGGLVKEGSLVRGESRSVSFVVTDNTNDVPATYAGLLPDLFREGQGVVAEGVLDGSGRLQADNVLAKHDERYMPREVADALKKQGTWQGDSAPAGQGASTPIGQGASTPIGQGKP